MKHRNTPFLGIAGLLLAMLIVACGTSTGSSGGGRYSGGNTGASQTATAAVIANANASATAAATSSGYGGCGRYCSQPTPTPTSSSSAVAIKIATITVGGQSMTVLTNGQGLTLYYRTSDTPSSVCSGGCASAWPPIISKTIPTAPSSLPGKLGLLNDANGSQVTYNGHPLYNYSGDTGPGQSSGQGIGNIWFVVTTDLPA